MRDFWGWLTREGRPRGAPQGVRRTSPLSTLTCPMWASRGGSWSFREWLCLRYPSIPLFEASDVGLRAFIDSQNRSFHAFLRELLSLKKITDPRLVQEAEALLADP